MQVLTPGQRPASGTAASAPRHHHGLSGPSSRHQRRAPGLPLALGVTLVLIGAVAGCDRDVTLVEPLDFFDFDPANAWRQCTEGAAGTPQQPSPSGAFVPPPPGVNIEVCPNPAPAGTEDMRFVLQLDIDARVNLAVFDDRGRLITRLLVNRNLGTGAPSEVRWFIETMPPGDYRAYFKAGALESSSDLRIEP